MSVNENDRDTTLLTQAVQDVYTMIDDLTLFEKELMELSDTVDGTNKISQAWLTKWQEANTITLRIKNYLESGAYGDSDGHKKRLPTFENHNIIDEAPKDEKRRRKN